MKASEIFNICLQRLGLTPEHNGEELYKALTSKAAQFINDIYLDLSKISQSQANVPIESLADEISLPAKAIPALIYGVCMYLALESGERENYSLYSQLYASQRLTFSHATAKKEVV